MLRLGFEQLGLGDDRGVRGRGGRVGGGDVVGRFLLHVGGAGFGKGERVALLNLFQEFARLVLEAKRGGLAAEWCATDVALGAHGKGSGGGGGRFAAQLTLAVGDGVGWREFDAVVLGVVVAVFVAVHALESLQLE